MNTPTFNQHNYGSTSSAYNDTQCNEDTHLGDILIIPSACVVGISDTWPVAVTVKHGQLHTPRTGGDNTIDSLIASMNEYNDKPVDFKEAFRQAVTVAHELGYDVNPFFLGLE